MVFIVLRFRSPRQALAFAGLLVVGLTVYLTYLGISSRRAVERASRRNALIRAVTETTTEAREASERALKSCLEAHLAIVKRALPGGVMTAAAVAAPDRAALRGASFINMKSPSGLSLKTPVSAWSTAACDRVTIPEDLKAASFGMRLPTDDEAAMQAIVARAREHLATVAATPPVPPMVGVTDYKCPSATKVCTGVMAWIARDEARVVSALRVDKPMRHLGYDKDADELTALLGAELAGWK